MNATIKKAFLLVFLIAVCGNATDEWKFDYETGADKKYNFTTGQRWATFGLNIVPGVGSYFIMDDMTGAIVQWSLSGGGLALLAAGLSIRDNVCAPIDDGGNCRNIAGGVAAAGLYGIIGSSFIYNIYRSITYDKPKQTAFGENSGFNLAVLPNRNGKLNAFLMYNKAF